MKKILIVEDDAIVSSVYKSLLESRGFQVDVAGDGQSGYYKMSEVQPDAVLLDIMLPKMNGVEILRKIRAQRQFQGVPILVFTNAYVPNMVETAQQAGANFVFSKSTLTPQQLIDALNFCLGFSTSFLPASASMQATPQMNPPAPAAPPPAPQPPPPPARSTRASELLSDSSPYYSEPPALRSGPPSAPPPQPYWGQPSPVVYVPLQTTPQPPAQAPAAGQSGATILTPNFTVVPEPTGPPTSMDLEVQKELKAEFMRNADACVTAMRQGLGDLNRVNLDSAKGEALETLYRTVRTVGGNAGLAGYRPVADLCGALEALVAELIEKPKNLNPSIQRTLGNTVDTLTQLLVRRVEENVLETPPPSILVVDDEVLSRRAVTFALDKGHLKSVALEKPEEALKMASLQAFDLIFLDVQMPGLNGFDLCAQIRAKSVNQNTPVIFVTSMSDFKSRARSTMSGATDLIAKPFMFIELTVKAISTLLQNRVLKPQPTVKPVRRVA